MAGNPEDTIAKTKVPIEVEHQDGSTSMGFVFLSPHGRLSDLANDTRKFLPFEGASGKFSLLLKSGLTRITPLNQEKDSYAGSDPFSILGVSPDISLEDLKKAYFKLCVDQHPDKIKGLGLPADFIELANIRMARINEAYQRAVKQKAAETGQVVPEL